MSTEGRVAALLREAVDAVPVDPPPVAALRARAAQRRRRRPRLPAWGAPLLAAAAVFAVLGLVVVRPSLEPVWWRLTVAALLALVIGLVGWWWRRRAG